MQPMQPVSWAEAHPPFNGNVLTIVPNDTLYIHLTQALDQRSLDAFHAVCKQTAALKSEDLKILAERYGMEGVVTEQRLIGIRKLFCYIEKENAHQWGISQLLRKEMQQLVARPDHYRVAFEMYAWLKSHSEILEKVDYLYLRIDIPTTNAIAAELTLFKNLYRLNILGGNPTKRPQTMPEVIRTFNKLMYLEMPNTGLSAVPNWIGDFSELYELNLSENSIETLPDSMSALQTLAKIDLSDNRFLAGVPPVLARLNKLQTLNLSLTTVTHIPEWLFSSYQPFGFSKCNLGLQGTPLLELPKVVLERLDSLRLSVSHLQTLTDESMRWAVMSVISSHKSETTQHYRDQGNGISNDMHIRLWNYRYRTLKIVTYNRKNRHPLKVPLILRPGELATLKRHQKYADFYLAEIVKTRINKMRIACAKQILATVAHIFLSIRNIFYRTCNAPTIALEFTPKPKKITARLSDAAKEVARLIASFISPLAFLALACYGLHDPVKATAALIKLEQLLYGHQVMTTKLKDNTQMTAEEKTICLMSELFIPDNFR